MKAIKITELRGTTAPMSDAELQSVKGGPAYLKLGDVKGESKPPRRNEWITFTSVSSPS